MVPLVPELIPASIEDAILAAIIAPDTGPRTQDPGPLSDPAALAARFQISLSRLLDFLAAPATRARIAAAVELQDLALHRRAQSARAKALDHLEKLLDTSEDPVERRRAASAILRPIHRRAPWTLPSASERSRAAPPPNARPDPDGDRPPPGFTANDEVLTRARNAYDHGYWQAFCERPRNPDDNSGPAAPAPGRKAVTFDSCHRPVPRSVALDSSTPQDTDPSTGRYHDPEPRFTPSPVLSRSQATQSDARPPPPARPAVSCRVT